MSANKFGRYVWLVYQICYHPYITFKGINERWEYYGLSGGKPLPLENLHES